jgi:hypothetical protein
MSEAASLALAFLMTEHAAQNVEPMVTAPAKRVKSTKVEKAVTAPNADGALKTAIQEKTTNVVPSDNGAKVKGIELPAKGSVGARGFLKLYNSAGHRKSEAGADYVDQREVRDDRIKAIAAFIGYDKSLPFGDNEFKARSQAMREIREEKEGPSKVDPYAPRRPHHSVAGYVAGVPNGQQKIVMDLLARESAAAEAMSAFEQKMNASPKGSQDFLLNQGLMLVEQERLGEIRKHLKSHGGY